jgi:hypothetical protein
MGRLKLQISANQCPAHTDGLAKISVPCKIFAMPCTALIGTYIGFVNRWSAVQIRHPAPTETRA